MTNESVLRDGGLMTTLISNNAPPAAISPYKLDDKA